MSRRRRIVLGNWKQNLLRAPAGVLASAIAAELPALPDEVVVGMAPTYLALDVVATWCRPRGRLVLAAQDVAAQEHGAFTGEVGPAMLREAGVEMVIIGHSERRAGFGDHDELVKAKVRAATSAGLEVILCVGESLDARDAGRHVKVVEAQLAAALSAGLPHALVNVAYEPIWAIGTGRTAESAQVAEMHGHIRAWLRAQLGASFADRSLLYGGSVKPQNARELASVADVDGFLVGGASLEATSFLDIVAAVL